MRLPILLVPLILLGCAATAADEPAADADAYAADAYAPCAACHLPDGVGISGAFPKIRDRAAAIAALEGGREFLITVVSFGLMGPMTADGTSYAGVMPGHSGSMQADAVASALNYLVFELVSEKPAEPEAFTVEEVKATQQATQTPSPMTAAEMRSKLEQQHGEAWPQ